MSLADDPDADAWAAAAQTTEEELLAQLDRPDGEAYRVGESPRSWKLREVRDTRPLEEYEP